MVVFLCLLPSMVQFVSTSAVFSPDGRYVVAGHPDGRLTMWEAGTGRLLKEWQAHSDSVLSIAYQLRQSMGPHLVLGLYFSHLECDNRHVGVYADGK
jgi:WD40 repeat protein